MLEWWSISVSTIRSPLRMFAAPHERATRLIASVALRTKITSRLSAAPTWSAIVARAPSYAAVASADIVCAPRWTFEWWRRS